MRLIFLCRLSIVVTVLALTVFAGTASQPFPQNYLQASRAIIDAVNTSGINFSTLEYICDTFGPRYRGTPGLDNALKYISSTMQSQGFKVTRERVVNITNWQRGAESLRLVSPRSANMLILGLGSSVSGNVTAEVIVVTSWDDLAKKASQVPGKIVLYNVPFVTYGQTVQYRARGASALRWSDLFIAEASKVGAVGALVRSITPFSLYTPHTGEQYYEPGVTPVPVAAVTLEDAEMLARMYSRGQRPTVELQMSAQMLEPTTAYNILAQIDGCSNPKEVVVIGGHSDSWDVGQGAIDDGGGFFSAWQAAVVIKNLVKKGLLHCPKRSIRVVLWVDEEISQRGAATYFQDHLAELPDHIIAIESDIGNFDPYAFGFTGLPAAQTIMEQIGSVLLSPIGAGNITDGALALGADTDNGPMCAVDCHSKPYTFALQYPPNPEAQIPSYYGVPCGSLENEGDGVESYFWYHHTNADNIIHMNQKGLADSVAAMAIVAYVLADMDQRLPTNYTAPSPSPATN